MKGSVKFISIIVLLCMTGAFAADWPQYLGPNRDSTSAETGILRSWPEGGPEVLWTVDVGRGFGGPVVVDGKVYLLDRDDEVGDTMRCYDLSNGDELWNYGYSAPGSVQYPGSRSVPIVDGNNVYACGHNGDLYCIDINTHRSVWNKNIWTGYGGDQVPRWAITQCPLIYGDLLIVASQAPQAGVVAYDKITGEEKWVTEMSGSVGYVSPSIVKVGGEDHVVMITASSMGFGRGGGGGGASSGTVGIDPEDGEILWSYTGWQCIIPIAHAVDAGEGKMLITAGYRSGAVMIQVQKADDGSYDVTELYTNAVFGSHTQPPVLYKDHFYAQCTTNESSYGLVCMSMDGEIKWQTDRSPSFNKGGYIIVDDLLITVDGLTTLYLIEPDPSEFKPLASAVLLGEGTNWAPLALSDGKLFIRDQEKMLCLKVAE